MRIETLYTLDYLPAALIGILEAETYLNEHSARRDMAVLNDAMSPATSV